MIALSFMIVNESVFVSYHYWIPPICFVSPIASLITRSRETHLPYQAHEVALVFGEENCYCFPEKEI